LTQYMWVTGTPACVFYRRTWHFISTQRTMAVVCRGSFLVETLRIMCRLHGSHVQ